MSFYVIKVGDSKNPATEEDVKEIKDAIEKDKKCVITRCSVEMYDLETGKYGCVSELPKPADDYNTLLLIFILALQIILIIMGIKGVF